MVEGPGEDEGDEPAGPLPAVDGAAASEVAVEDPVSLVEVADAGRTDRLEARLADHVEPDERVRVAWVVRQDAATGSAGHGSEAESGGRTVYAATDRRLLAVEPDRPVRSTPFARRPAAPALALGAGLLVAVLGFLGGAVAASGWTALLLVVTCVGGLALAEHGRQLQRDAGGSRERPATAVTAVGVGLDDGAVVRESGATVGGRETAGGGDGERAAAGDAGPATADDGDPASPVSRRGDEAVAAGDDD